MTEVASQSAETQMDWTRHIDKNKLQIGCSVALIVVALVQAWLARYEIAGDFESYLDIARSISEGHSSAAFNGLWSPGFPVLFSPFLSLLRPNVYWEGPLAHVVIVLIFVGALASFQLFWNEVWLSHDNYVGARGAKIPESAFWALGYAAFGIAALNIITVSIDAPDMLVGAFCCLAGWTTLRFRRAPDIGPALLLGLVLALGYYAKAPFFPIGFVFLLCASFGWPVSRRTTLLGGAALATFLLVCAPFIVALSLSKGRFTWGDSARLNYAFHVNGVRNFVHWQGGPAGSGIPIHPTRKLDDHPEIYEFGAKNMGTYPPWFDPTYWYEGVTLHLDWNFQMKLFAANLALVARYIVESGAELVCAAIILALLASCRRPWIKGFWQLWFIWLPGAIALVMFALVHVEPRYFGGYLILLFAGAICPCSLPADSGTRTAVACIGFAVLITVGAALTLQTSQEVIESRHALGRSNPSIAVFLINNGLNPGDKVAVIGDGKHTYWAHLAQLSVVAEIPPNTRWYNQPRPLIDFWEWGQEQQTKALEILQRTGARAVIADPQALVAVPTASTVPKQWKKIDGTDAYVYFFHRYR